MAAESERNFRSQYYEKVGFRGVEEKKSLEILLKEQPLDLPKLTQFSLRFPVPEVYRLLVWNVLLDVLPSHQEVHEYVLEQRVEQFNELLRALRVTGVVTEHTPEPEIFLKVYLEEDGMLPFDHRHLMSSPSHQAFVHMATASVEVCDVRVQRFWLTYKLHKLIDKYEYVFPALIELIEQTLKREDKDGRLVNHFMSHNLLDKLPIDMWFRCVMTNVLPESSFERIWDKVIAGCLTILSYATVSMFLTLRRSLLSITDVDAISHLLQKMEADTGDVIVSKAIEMWQKQGAQLLPSLGASGTTNRNNDSPVFVEKTSFSNNLVKETV